MCLRIDLLAIGLLHTRIPRRKSSFDSNSLSYDIILPRDKHRHLCGGHCGRFVGPRRRVVGIRDDAASEAPALVDSGAAATKGLRNERVNIRMMFERIEMG